uniref:Autophagy related 2B n=1 Tax=Sphaeramia orbicularis TaxID=375764 RepID=A0A673BIZ7_9TELE
MPWPFSESIKKRACRYLLHRYLGNFLQEKLSLDQLSLDLYQGTGSLAQVPLDKWSLNELLETADAPFEVIAGFIQTISLTVPWAALLQENCALEVKGLEMVFRPRPRAASGIEPMYWSSFMTSSMQLAKECLSQKLTDDMGESFQPFEGLEKFAETIETVLRRVRVTFLDTVLRVEHIPENSKTGIALEIRINKIVYCDETDEESSSVNVHQPTTFAHKNLQMEGITIFWDEFSDAPRAGCKSSPPPTVAHPSKHGDESRPELVLKLTLGSLAVSVLHIDPLPPPDATPSPLGPMASHFFRMVGLGQLAPAAFLQSRMVLNQACPHDHLRFVGQGLKISYEHCQGSSLRTYSTDVSLNQMELLECLFPSDAGIGGSQRGIQYTEVRVSPAHLVVMEIFIISQHKAFTEVFLDDSHTPANCHVSLTVNAPVLGLAVRFPIPDLRSDQERGPWFKKSLQKEVLHLELEDLEVKTEFMGGSSDQTKMELTFRELIGVCRVVLKMNPTAVHSILERVTAEDDEGAEDHSLEEEEEEGAAHSLKDVCDFGKPEPSPFSSRRVMYENEEMVIPGDVAEMTEFQEKTMNNSRFILELCFPNVQLALPSKGFYEKLHNRYRPGSKLISLIFSFYLDITNSLFYGWFCSVFFQKEDKTILKNKHGEFWLEVKNAVLFSVTQYEGYKDQHYICFHTSSVCMYHQGKSVTPIILHVDAVSGGVSLFMQEFLVAIGVRGATLQHRVVPPSLGWYDQIVDFLNVSDEPVLGYAPPTSVTTLHLHLWSCSLDYRPLYLPLRSLLVVETFSISSRTTVFITDIQSHHFLINNIKISTIFLVHFVVSRIILDETALFLSDKNNAVSVNLARDYVQVVDMGTLELRITAVKPGVDGKLLEPRFELRCSSDVIHIRTCSDSCAALMNLIQYVASYGDLVSPAEPEAKHSSATQRTKVSFWSYILILSVFCFFFHQVECPSRPTLQGPLLAETEQQMLQDLMSEAMEETDTDDFCILETPGSRGEDRDQEPVVKHLTSDPVEIKDDHFSHPMEGSDSSRGTLNFPIPEVRYLIKEISVIWHLYGGKDFGSATFTASPARSRGSPSQTPVRQARGSGRAGGGKGRNPDVLMEIQLSKVKLRFQHEVYPQSQGLSGSVSTADQPVSRQVFVVQDLEIRDRLATSQMNKFLYLYSSKEMPRKAHSNMLTVKALHMCPESGQAPQECCLRVSLMPLRLNIDQDALFFLKDFFTSLATEVEFFSPPAQEGNIDHLQKNPVTSQDPPIFFREFRFTSEVPIRLDYHGKHVAMEQGTFAGIIIGLTQLNCSELKLRRLCYRQGLLGVDKLFSYAINEWLNDIKKNQLPGLLGGVGPIHSLVQLVQGFRDLVWLPIEQYRKDGRIVRGFQRGTASFGTSTAMAALELTNRMVRTIQAAAETAYDMVSPVPDERDMKRIKRYSHYGLAHQPVDLREGVAKAYTVVKEGITDTALTIYDTATREHGQRGMTGAVGGVLRQLPPAVVKPLIMATEATSNVLGGMRNQIHPDARQEESQKWRQGEE